MANARVLGRREQLIAHGSALTATGPRGRVLLDSAHVVFPMLKVSLRRNKRSVLRPVQAYRIKCALMQI
jgi:hypothetical protein